MCKRQLTNTLLATCLLILSCTQKNIEVTGGSSDTEVGGQILGSTNKPIEGIAVSLFSENFHPLKHDSSEVVFVATTNSTGEFMFQGVKPGIYNLKAENEDNKNSLFLTGVEVYDSTLIIAPQKLEQQSVLLISDSKIKDHYHEYLYIAGSDIYTKIDSNNYFKNNAVLVVPPGIITEVLITNDIEGTIPITVEENIQINSNDTLVILDSGVFDWTIGGISGYVVDENNFAISDAMVRLYQVINITDAFHSTVLKDSVPLNDHGYYKFEFLDPGYYTLEINNSIQGYSSHIFLVHRIPIVLDTFILQAYSSIELIWEYNKYDEGNLILKGSSQRKIMISNLKSNNFVIPNVSVGCCYELVYEGKPGDTNFVVITNFEIKSSSPFIIKPYDQWIHTANIYLNTSSSGADLNQLIENYPLAIRLNSTNFNFNEVQEGAIDLRFAKVDGSPIPYSIEEWDSSNERALVWVLIDSVKNDSQLHYLNMFWGKTNVSSNNESNIVFDSSHNFSAVLHLDENLKDETSNNNIIQDGKTQSIQGVLGKARFWKAADSTFIKIQDHPSINPETTITVSAWINTLDLEGTGEDISILRHDGHFTPLQITGRAGVRTAIWANDSTHSVYNWENVFNTGEWIYFSAQYHYVKGLSIWKNGVLFHQSTTHSGKLKNRGTDLFLGKAEFNKEYYTGFIDEFRISNNILSPNQIKLDYESQKPGSNFVSIKIIR